MKFAKNWASPESDAESCLGKRAPVKLSKLNWPVRHVVYPYVNNIKAAAHKAKFRTVVVNLSRRNITGPTTNRRSSK